MNLNELLNKYLMAKKVLEKTINKMLDEFVLDHNYNPVEHLKSRIKTRESIINKLNNKQLDINLENIENNIKDVIGIRIVCSFITDVYDIVSLISNLKNIEIIERKDYISNPKDTGYTSYHLIVLVPIKINGKVEHMKAEIQIRTVAEDFWASLSHKIQYKYENLPENIRKEMYEYSLIVNQLDKKMVDLNNLVNEVK